MTEPTDDYGILEQSRFAAIQSAANLLQAMAEAKKFRRRLDATRDDDGSAGDSQDEQAGGDYLFDLLRLNATYLNELSRLGRAYGGFAARALENLYALTKPGFKQQTVEELIFHRGNPQPRRFVVQNDVNPDVDFVVLRVPRVQVVSTGLWVNGLTIGASDESGVAPPRMKEVHSNPSELHYVLPVSFGIPRVVTLTADMTAYLRRRYDAWVIVELDLGNGRVRRRRIPVVIQGAE